MQMAVIIRNVFIAVEKSRNECAFLLIAGRIQIHLNHLLFP